MTSVAAHYELDQADLESPAPQVARRFLPWLMSMTSHLVLILSLALMLKFQAPTPRGVPDGSLMVTVVGDGAGGESGGGGGVSGFDSEVTTAAGSLEEQTPVAPENLAPNTGGELASMLDDVPPMELGGILPPAGSVLGSATAASGSGFSIQPATGDHSATGVGPKGSGGGSGGVGRGKGTRNGSGLGNGVAEALDRGKGRTGVFGVSGSGYKFIYVFDRSGSMDGHGGAPLAAAKSELIHSIERLDQTHQFQIVFYNEQPRAFGGPAGDGRMVFATQQNKRLAERFVGGIIADGSTQHEGALVLALRLNPDVIFFLTDADEPTLSARQLDRISRLNNGTSINTIEFGYGPQQDEGNFLVRLARQNGGAHAYVDIAELPAP